MHRRQVLTALGAVATAGLAGCGGAGDDGAPDGPPTGPGRGNDGSGTVDDIGPVTAYPSFEAADFRVFNDSGQVTVEVLVNNPANRRRTMVLNVSTRVDGERVSDRQELAIDPDGNRTVNATLPVAYDDWGGALDISFEAAE